MMGYYRGISFVIEKDESLSLVGIACTPSLDDINKSTFYRDTPGESRWC